MDKIKTSELISKLALASDRANVKISILNLHFMIQLKKI